MTAVVVVSHSRTLARAAVELAEQMVPVEQRVPVRVAAGLDGSDPGVPDASEGGAGAPELGTDATAVAACLEELQDQDAILVLTDLGSALLSAEMALDFVDPDLAARVRISPAPLVEGLVAALVTASSGADIDEVDRQARGALQAKTAQLGQEESAPAPQPPPQPAAGSARAEAGEQAFELELLVRNPHGLHARPCAAIVAAVAGLDATVLVRREGSPAEAGVDARSVMSLQALAVRRGELLLASITGPQASAARTALGTLAANDFGEQLARPGPHTLAEPESPVHELSLAPALPPAEPTADQQPRLETALAAADGFLEGLAAKVPDGGVTRAVLWAIRTMLHDPMLEQGFARRIGEGQDAAVAVHQTMTETIAVFEQMANPYLRERATDLRSLERLVLRALASDLDLSLDEVPSGHVLLLDELDAVTAAQLDPTGVPMVLVRRESTHGHGLLVARDRGIDVHFLAGSQPEGQLGLHA